MNIQTKFALCATTICGLLHLASLPLMASAQNQDVNVRVNPYFNFSEPVTLNLPQVFMNPTGDTTIYSAWLPSDLNSQIRVTDLRENGGFTIDLSIDNFTNTARDVIPYTNVGIVTLAEAEFPDTIDTPSGGSWNNSPTGTDGQTVLSNLDCDWDFANSFALACNDTFQNFTGGGSSSTPQNIIDGSNPTGAGRVGEYWVSLGLRLTVPEGTPGGDYTSTFTFTVTQL